jgi:adenosylhomocysteine nucleosidase
LSRVGIVAALATEARALTATVPHRGMPHVLPDGTLLIVSGIGTTAASAAALTLRSQGADALMSFGLAGGLDPTLRAGRIFLPAEVLAADHGSFQTSSAWRTRLAGALTPFLPLAEGSLLTSLTAITSVEAKAALFRATGARAVDMESAAVAQVAALHRLPFLVARVIVDTATDTLPAAVMAASQSGAFQFGRLLAALARAPAQIIDLIRLGGRFRAAHSALRAVGRSHSLREAFPP